MAIGLKERAWLVGALSLVSLGLSAAESVGQVPGNPPGESPSQGMALPQPSFRLPDDRLGARVSPILLLSREDVIADLKLDEYQSAQAQQAIGELYEQAAALRGRREPEVVEARKQIDSACSGWIQQWLSEDQQSRLIQIDLQWEGPSALVTRPTVGASLELTEAQRNQLRLAVQSRDEMRRAGKTVLEAEHVLAEQALELLQPRQAERWKAMLGEVFRPNIGGSRDSELKTASGTVTRNPSRP